MKARIWSFLYQMASPYTFCTWADSLLPFFFSLALVCSIYGILGGLIWAPPDYQQGDAFRIIYIHVPSAFLSLMAYSVMSFCSLLYLVWRIKMADLVHQVVAPMGALFTALALITGAIWGKPMWGTWWIWDARLTSELILLFLYLGIIGLRQSIANTPEAARAVAIFTLVGFLDIPLIHYSVAWWNTLHQGATLSVFAKPKIDSSMLYPLLSMIVAFISYFAAMTLYRTRSLVLQQYRASPWIHDYIARAGQVSR